MKNVNILTKQLQLNGFDVLTSTQASFIKGGKGKKKSVKAHSIKIHSMKSCSTKSGSSGACNCNCGGDPQLP